MKQTRLIQVLAVVGILGCSSCGKIVGTIYVIGNEPFTQVAVEDSTGTLYRIETTKELERQLRALQGRTVELRYTKLTTTATGRTIVVASIHESGHR